MNIAHFFTPPTDFQGFDLAILLWMFILKPVLMSRPGMFMSRQECSFPDEEY